MNRIDTQFTGKSPKNYWSNPGHIVFLGAFLLSILAIPVSCKKSGTDDDGPPVFGNCQGVKETSHFTTATGTFPYTYTTSGGGKIVISQNAIIISHADYAGFTIEFWGTDPGQHASYNHENMNGKHVKDRLGEKRSLIFPDGAKITINSQSITGPALSITIYEGNEVHHLNLSCNTLEYSAASSPYAKEIDDEETDGETSTFEFTSTGLLWVNIYSEYTAGVKVMNRVKLAEIFRANPNQVNDYF